jgi:uncharacterized protein
MEVVHVPERSRYELRDGEVVLGRAEYVQRGDVLDVHHTEIVPARRGTGLGAVLVGGMLDHVRADGRTVIPTCWFVADFLDANPGHADLRHR